MTENVETTFQKVFRVIVEQRDITIPERGINPETPLLDIFGSTRQPLWAGFKFFRKLKKVFVEQEYFFDYDWTNEGITELKTVGDLVKVIDSYLYWARERRTRASTFERVRMNAQRTSEEKDLGLSSINPSSTLKELEIDMGMLGSIDFFDALVEDFQADHPNFNLELDEWIDIKTIGEVVNLVENKLGKVLAGG